MCCLRTRVAAMSLVLGMIGLAQTAFAIDPRGIQIGKQWTVVGVIADGDTKGIAVIKELDSEKTYTVKIGDQLPSNGDFWITEVRRKQVVLSDGNQQVMIDYQTPKKDAWAEEEEETVSRFAESYFNGFTTVPIEYYQRRKEQGLAAGEMDGLPFSMKKVPDDSVAARDPEYGLFRKERAYGSSYTNNDGYEEDPAASDVVVNYDNFTAEDEFQNDEDAQARYRRRLREDQPRWETVPKRVLDEDYSGNSEDETGMDVIEVPEDPQYDRDSGYENENWENEEEPTDW